MRKAVGTLVGALAISSMAMAGTVDPSSPAVDGTNVWATGQTGSIAVKGRMISEKKVDEVKYVIYAGEDKSDVLNLPDFILSMDKDKCGFVKEPDNIYVKRVENGKIVDLLPQDGYKYKMIVTSGYTQRDWSEGGTAGQVTRVMRILEKDTKEKLKAEFGDKFSVDEWGQLTNDGRFFDFPTLLGLNSDKNGVIKFTTSSEGTGTFTPDEVAKVMKVFKDGVMTDSDVKIQVKMD